MSAAPSPGVTSRVNSSRAASRPFVVEALVLLFGATTERARDAAELAVRGERHHESVAAVVELGQAVLQQRKRRRSVGDVRDDRGQEPRFETGSCTFGRAGDGALELLG